MLSHVHRWLNTTALTDPVERRQAGMFQGMLLILIGACLLGIGLGLVVTSQIVVITVTYLVILVFIVVSLVLLRRGYFAPAVLLSSGAIVCTIGFSLIASGLADSSTTLLAFSVPIAMAGLLQGRRGLLFTTALSIAFVAVTAALQLFAPALVGFIPVRQQTSTSTIVSFILLVTVLGLFIDRFGTSLRRALGDARAYAHELEQLQSSLESTVAERTASLQAALGEVAQREAHLTQALAALQASKDDVRALSAPILPVLPGVLVAPLIGDVDSERAALLTNNVLMAVEQQQVHHVIFDITGVPVVDTQVAQVLLQAANAVRLLGARTLLVGVRPEVAQTLVSLGIDMQAIATYPDLRAAVGTLLA